MMKQRRVKPCSTSLPIIYGSDRDAGAIEIANANALRAGVSGMITFHHHALSDLKEHKGEYNYLNRN